MRSILAAALCLLCSPALAQQQVPMTAQCFPADMVIDHVQSGRATMTEVLSDPEGDAWVLIENKDNGAVVVGVFLRAQGLFCAVGGRPPKTKGDKPARGA